MKNRTKTITFTLLLIAVCATALTAWWFWGRQEPLAEGLIQANGRIEGDHYTVASKFPGRLNERTVSEGDWVNKGQILAKLDDAQVQAKVEQAKATVKSLEAQLAAAHTGLAMVKKIVPLKVESAKAEINHAEARLKAARARGTQACKEGSRRAELLASQTISQECAEQADLNKKVADADLASARAARTQAQKNFTVAKLGWDQVKVKEGEVAALSAQVVQVKAALKEAQSVVDDLTLYAPAMGIITTCMVEAGEIVAAGSPLLDIVNLDRLYLKVYIPENKIGKVRLGLPARIHTDAFPDKFFPATVRYISSRAEFTPKEVQTPDERVKMVYAVKLYLSSNPDHRLTPGLPADAIIRWQKEVPWANPRW
ncbi:MAG: efflux RND transporter periplasmic adaptor subunit [Thermodesulfobacteriota bacterium]|nr:efflux RND transporter periplasmic adaptor subunit [Thermodesulfobacteriota bacterium]